ncbi:MAG: pyridine nucleotide-disulfide oxidoreductase [Xanthomarina sp.]|jgi:flavin-dependent dehydrogenase|uniref:NAD(P)/FAD-dependent oxidoreductase n=1 Tax=Xanthomarina TaxID=1868329 RepID=UPI000C6AC5B9|nr:NAD(P)/FAD-dependent oxidoreductase [Xanthomarina sp.]MAL21786.1 pyridine nucleotide-disulfide oxidoreductase [Xanthomarina sp.]MBF62141.1 pyridine nucleotide-disulfide oxidoreductase [Xanthomarina sp.]
MNDIHVDVLIIGAGPSGCVAAAYLNNQGYDIKVVEKSVFPRFVIGESLLPRCMDHFEEVGLLDCLKAANFELKPGARFLRGDVVCNFDFSDKHSEGWDWTWQVPRADFDHILVKEIIKKGVDVSFEHEVTAVEIADDGSSKTTIKTKEGDTYTIHAKFIIDSSGYGRVLPRLLDLDKPSALPDHSSIFTHVKDVNREEGTEGTLITFDVLDKDTWFWVIPFSNGNTSLGFVSKTEYIDSFKGSNTERMKEMLKLSDYYYDRFKDVDFLFEPINIKNYSKSVKQLYGKGYALTGNSSEFLDPVFSSGVTFATESALMSAKLISKELRGELVDWEEEYSNYIKYGVAVFSTYVKEWYTGNLQTLFFHRPENPDVKRQICAVLAGYVWDKTNPFVTKHDRIVKTLAHLIDMEKEQSEAN